VPARDRRTVVMPELGYGRISGFRFGQSSRLDADWRERIVADRVAVLLPSASDRVDSPSAVRSASGDCNRRLAGIAPGVTNGWARVLFGLLQQWLAVIKKRSLAFLGI